MASSREVAPIAFGGCAWEEAKRGTPPWTAGRVSFRRCQPLPAAPPKGQESTTRRGARSPRPGENHPSVPWMHPWLGCQLCRAPSTGAKREMLQSDHATLPASMVAGTAPSLRERSSKGVEPLSHYVEWGKNPSGTNPREGLCEIC